jgi:hypothetical protein
VTARAEALRRKIASAAKRIRLRPSPQAEFWSSYYLRHNQRRLEHLASLNYPIAGKSVLEVGAGIGDHSSFFLDRGCKLTITEARSENLLVIRKRFPDLEVAQLDLDKPDPAFVKVFEVVYCYGTLYHLRRPADAIKFLRLRCGGLLLLETCVSFGEAEELNPVKERSVQASQAVSGSGCRPTRQWVYARLKEQFPHVYLPITQPWHEEFPLNWITPSAPRGLIRATFAASTQALENPLLCQEIPAKQIRH